MNQTLPSKLDQPEILSAIFHPRQEQRTDLPELGIETEIAIPQSETVLGCRFYRSSSEAPNIVYFHGNGETVNDYDTIVPFYLEAGFNIFVATYRGYGWSTGEPSVSALFDDGAIVLHYFISYCRENNLSEEIFVMGRSLGSACSIDLAYRYPELLKGLIIESGFANTLPLAARLGYDVTRSGLTEQDCFNNLMKIEEISLPTLILHGAEDQLIPLAEAVKLQAESGAKTKQLFIVPGADHNSLISNGGQLYFETIKNFTNTVTGKNTWRKRRKKFKKQRDT
jgi:hypothetical protein